MEYVWLIQSIDSVMDTTMFSYAFKSRDEAIKIKHLGSCKFPNLLWTMDRVMVDAVKHAENHLEYMKELLEYMKELECGK